MTPTTGVANIAPFHIFSREILTTLGDKIPRSVEKRTSYSGRNCSTDGFKTNERAGAG